MVRFEVSNSAAIASAVSGFRVRRSTWMIWNSRSARLMGFSLFCLYSRAAIGMLTACWQQGSVYRDNTPTKGILSMMILYGLDLWTTISPLLTPRWQQGLANLKRLLKKSGTLT